MNGTPEEPWVLKTPSGGSEFTAHRDESLDPPALVVQVGKTQVRYHLRCLDDLEAMLRERGDWVPLGSADEQKPAAEGTVEAWARAEDNPVGGWYGLKKGCAAASATTCRRSWRRWAAPRSSTTRATTACARSSSPPAERLARQGVPSGYLAEGVAAPGGIVVPDMFDAEFCLHVKAALTGSRRHHRISGGGRRDAEASAPWLELLAGRGVPG